MLLVTSIPLAVSIAILILSAASRSQGWKFFNGPPPDLKSSSSSSTPVICSLFLYQSEVIPGAGFGIIAGRDFSMNELVEEEPGITLSTSLSRKSQLDNYVFSPPDADAKHFTLNLLGIGGLLNHENNLLNTKKMWHVHDRQVSPASSQNKPFTTYTPLAYYASKDILAGQEIFNTYSDDDTWFREKGLSGGPKETNFRIEYKYLEEYGICLSDVVVAESRIPLAGRGLFASKSFSRGQLVTVSPLIVVSKAAVEHDAGLRHMVLYNYCVSHERAGGCFIATGQAAFINHAEESQANIKIEWYDRNGYDALQERLKKNLTELGSMLSSSLDFTYRATRDIAAGEELMMYYGAHWGPAWDSYLKKKRAVFDSPSTTPTDDIEDIAADDNYLPLFRQFIRAPDGLFPAHWLEDPVL